MAASSTASLDTLLQFSEDSGNAYPVASVTPTFQPSLSQYTAGTNAGMIDVAYMGRQSVPNGAPVSLDLSGGGLKTPLGNTATFARVAVLAVHNRSTNTVTLTGNFLTTSFGASFSMPLTAGGRFIYDNPSATGLAVTNSTADTITLTSSAGTNDVDVAVAGRSV
jgi:hypothetical protein